MHFFSRPTIRWFLFALVVIVVSGWALRSLVVERDLMFDDVYSVQYAQMPLSQGIALTSQGVTATPLYFILLHVWMALWGDGEVAVRMLSVLAGLGSIVVMYFVGRAFVNRRTGVLASFLVSFSAIHVLLCIEVRMYTIVVFLALLSTYFFWKAIHSPKRIYYVCYVAASIALLYTHFQGWFVIGGQLLFCILCIRSIRSQVRRIGLALGAVGAAFVPWLLFSVLPNMADGRFFESWTHYIQYDYTRFMVFNMPLNFMMSLSYLPRGLEFLGAAWYVFFLAMVFFAFFRWRQSKKAGRRPASLNVYLLVQFIIPLLVFLVFVVPLPKYYIVASIPLYLWAARGMDRLWDKQVIRYASLVMVALSPLLFLPRMLPGEGNSRENSIRYVEPYEEPGDIIIVHHFKARLYFDYYYQGDSTVIGLYPTEDYHDLDEEIARYNSVLAPVLNPDNITILGSMTDGAKRVWYFEAVSQKADFYRSDLPRKWFSDQGWTVSDQVDLDYGKVTLYTR